LEAGTNVVRLKEVIFCKNFNFGRARSEQIQHILHPQTISSNAGSSAAFVRFNRDAIQKAAIHLFKLNCQGFPLIFVGRAAGQLFVAVEELLPEGFEVGFVALVLKIEHELPVGNDGRDGA
jgi:hypothetical protein